HTGTEQGGRVNGGGITRVGSDNLLMVNAHIGHDVQLGDNCILANNVMLAGHIVIGDCVTLNGAVGINAWVSVGSYAYIAGAARAHHDIPPFCKSDIEGRPVGINAVRLAREGLGPEEIKALEESSRLL